MKFLSPIVTCGLPVPGRLDVLACVGGDGPPLGGRAGVVVLAAADSAEQRFHELGDLLFAVVNVARKLAVDPELALRAAADRFKGRVLAGSELAASEGHSWDDLAPEEQLAYYARARLTEGAP